MKDESFILHPSSISTWSGRRDSNSRPSAWKADALPTELHPLNEFQSSNFALRIEVLTDFIGNPHLKFETPWCRGQDSNLRRALARRVYSPVPLTTRPPLQISAVKLRRRAAQNPNLSYPE